MAITQLTFALLLVSSAYALKQVFSDYDYTDYRGGEGEAKGLGHSGHWAARGSQHAGSGHGDNHHQHHYFDHSGGSEEGASKAGAHVKHRVTKGFQNYHHKDEVGKTTSYIDTTGDTGDHYGNYEVARAWGDHGHADGHKDHHASSHSDHEGLSHHSYDQKKEDFKKKKEGSTKLEKEEYKGDIADIIYAKKPAFQSKAFHHPAVLHHIPYPYYFY